MLGLGEEELGREMSRSTWISESSFATSSSRAGSAVRSVGVEILWRLALSRSDCLPCDLYAVDENAAIGRKDSDLLHAVEESTGRRAAMLSCLLVWEAMRGVVR